MVALAAPVQAGDTASHVYTARRDLDWDHRPHRPDEADETRTDEEEHGEGDAQDERAVGIGTGGDEAGGRPEGDQDGRPVFVVRVFHGEVEGVKLRDRLEAANWLADRGFGKPTQGVELAGKDGEPLLSLALVQAVVADAEGAATG
jgi:hypothetical protein